MARGDAAAANSVSEQTGLEVHNWPVDALLVMLCSDTYAAAAGFTDSAQFTEVAGGSYAAQTPTVSWTRAGSKSTLQIGNVTWGTDASGPTDIRTAVVFNTVAASDDVITFVDLTTDGDTPISLQAGGLAINFSSTPTLEVDKR